MNKLVVQLIFLVSLVLTLVNHSVIAASSTGYGSVANNLMAPVGLMSDFIYSGCLLIGGSFVFASIVKYFEYRRSPLMVPLSTVVFLLIAGLCLLALPFLSMIDSNALQFSLFQ